MEKTQGHPKQGSGQDKNALTGRPLPTTALEHGAHDNKRDNDKLNLVLHDSRDRRSHSLLTSSLVT